MDDGGNGRGTIQGRTVLLSTAAIPDAASYITYSFGIDVGNTQYPAATLAKAYHKLSLGADMPKGDIAIAWSTGSATLSGGAITGDATGKLLGNTILIAPNTTVAVGEDFTLTYNKIAAGGTKSVSKLSPGSISGGSYSGTISAGEAILGGTVEVNMGGGTVVATLAVNSSGLSLVGQSASSYLVSLTSSTVDLATGNISFTIKAQAVQTVIHFLPDAYRSA